MNLTRRTVAHNQIRPVAVRTARSSSGWPYALKRTPAACGRRLVSCGVAAPMDRSTGIDPSLEDVFTPPPTQSFEDRSHETDFVVIGSGIGGLCCAALLAKYGYRVTVCESHYLPGGAAHSFEIGGYKFDAGPSFFLGIGGPPGDGSPNPLKQVLDAVGERVQCEQYDRWIVHAPSSGSSSNDNTSHNSSTGSGSTNGSVSSHGSSNGNGSSSYGAGSSSSRTSFPVVASPAAYESTILHQGGPEALRQWRQLAAAMKPLQAAAGLFPAAALRADPGVLLTGARVLGGPQQLLGTARVAGLLTGPFSALVDRHVTHPWLRAFLDLECFVLSGMPARHTLCAEMAFMFGERHGGRSAIEYPLGGSRAIINALVRGIRKYGGRVLLRTHVEQILMEGGAAAGVRLLPRRPSSSGPAASSTAKLRNAASLPFSAGDNDVAAGPAAAGPAAATQRPHRPEVIRAVCGVVSNASVWDTQGLLPRGAAPEEWRRRAEQTPALDSFLHLHLGIDASGLPPSLDCHHLLVNSWDGLTAPQNVIIASVPSVFDPSLAPPGKAVVHCYCAANEPYGLWRGLDRRSGEYRRLKQQRVQPLWQALERFIPDIRARTELQLAGTPLTHERFLRRHRGSYGPGISAGGGQAWPGPRTPIPRLSVCGDSCMPGVGVPAAAASGMIAANSLAPVWSHLRMMGQLMQGSG